MRAAMALAFSLLTLAAAGAGQVFTFDDGEPHGWSANSDKIQFKITDEKIFAGQTKSLLLSSQAADYLGCSIELKCKDNDTRVVIVYFAEGLAGHLTVQAWSPTVKKNVHAEINPTVLGQWSIGEVKLAQFTDWDGKGAGKGAEFSNLQIYDTPQKGAPAARLFLARVVLTDGEDRTPPKAPATIRAAYKELAVEVVWAPAEDNVVTARYEVYRGMKPDFTPGPGNRVGEVAALAFRDDTLANFGAYFYRVIPIDAAGNRGPASETAKIAVVDQ